MYSAVGAACGCVARYFLVVVYLHLYFLPSLVRQHRDPAMRRVRSAEHIPTRNRHTLQHESLLTRTGCAVYHVGWGRQTRGADESHSLDRYMLACRTVIVDRCTRGRGNAPGNISHI